MSASSSFEEAASHLRQAICDNKLASLQTSDFRILIHETSSNKVPTLLQEQALKDLLAVLSSNQLSHNNRIVAATAYCKIVSNVEQETDKILSVFIKEFVDNKFHEWSLFLCHGIFQLSCWKSPSETGDELLEEIFTIVKRFCCELNSTCYLAFKVLHSLLNKIHQLYPTGSGISEDNFKSVLDIALSNWENPLSGVRQQNSLVFNQLLLFSEDYWIATLSKSTNTEIEWKFCGLLRHQNLLELVLSELSWTMKSKYFLLCSIVQDSNIPQILSKYGEDIINGLIISLSIPYLVSAGTDLYLALLASLSLKDWQHWFLKPFSKIISHEELSLGMENIFNYWTNQTLKKFPSVFEMLIAETGSSLYSLITLKKIGRKEGFFKWEDLDNQTLETAMRHHSEKIRSQLFSLVCTCSNNSSPPNNEEVDFVIKFLKENINSDDSALRQNLLKSLNNLMLRIRDSILNRLKLQPHINNPFLILTNNPLISSIHFLKWLYSFLLINLEDECNYQRKITSLEIFKIVFSCLCEDEVGNQYKRKSNNNSFDLRNCGRTVDVFKFGRGWDRDALVNCLFNEDNSIRSSAANILICYYNLKEYDCNDLRCQELLDKGIALSKDQMFYKADSGAVVVKVLASIAYKSSLTELKEPFNKGSDNFINVLLASAQEQFTQLREDLLKAASQGAFLYGTLQIIELLTSDPADPELSLKDDQQKRLLKLIEEVTDYFVSVLASKSESQSTSDYAPSFGEMGVAIAAIVEGSSAESSVLCDVATDNTMSDLQLTPAQQLVLNCIWMNLKACTMLCSKLLSSPMNVKDSKRCVSVVVSVLKKCRHKGAIESAGLALYNICSYLTKSDEPELVNLPEELLKDFLQNLIGTTAATVSRRSAGLAILVHRLITGDSRAKKPLLHLCVSRLLSVAEDSNVSEHAALVDLPQSQALHFLRTLVQESSLREHMVQYTLNISLVALNNLTSPLWTIRNAALQLFGALVPKLVGQKPNQEQGGGQYNLSFEELYTHAQPLVELILEELSSAVSCDSITSHSKVLPMLTLVTNLTLGLQAVLTPEIMNTIERFQQCFYALFKSRIFNVRKLSGKASALFATPSSLARMIEETAMIVINYIEGKERVIQSENELNGYILNLTHLFQRFEEDKRGMSVLMDKENKVHTILEELGDKLISAQCSYFTKALVFELKWSANVDTLFTMISSNIGKNSLGFSYFIEKMIKKLILTSSTNEVENIVHDCLLKKTCYDVQHSCLKALTGYGSKQNFESNHICVIFSTLKEYLLLKKHNLSLEPLVFETLLNLLEQVKDSSLSIPSEYFCSELLSYCLNVLYSRETLISVTNIVLPITCALFYAGDTCSLDDLLKVSTMIKTRSENLLDQDLRLSAAKSVDFLCRTSKLKKNDCRQLIWRACVDLLQDEVPEIRYETSKCISFLTSRQTKFVLNPYVSLEYLFQPDICLKFMTIETNLNWITEKFAEKYTVNSAGIYNPFDHGVKSIFAEDNVVCRLAAEGLYKGKPNVGDICGHIDNYVEDRFFGIFVRSCFQEYKFCSL